MMQTVSPSLTKRSTCAGAPATSRAAKANFSGKSDGRTAYKPEAKRIAWPSIST